MNPHTGRDFVQFGKTESGLNKGAEEIAPLFNPPPVLSLEIILNILYPIKKLTNTAIASTKTAAIASFNPEPIKE